MNFKQFNMAVNALKQQQEHDGKCMDALEIVFPDGGIMLYKNNVLVDTIVALLEHDTDDNAGWIQYFAWELDFGAKWKVGCVTDNGEDVKLQTNEDLWEFLIKNATE